MRFPLPPAFETCAPLALPSVDGGVQAFAMSPKAPVTVALSGGKVVITDVTGKAPPRVLTVALAEPTAVSFTPDGQLIAVGSRSGHLQTYDLSGEPVGEAERAHRGSVLFLGAGGKRLVSAGRDFQVVRLDANPLEAHRDDVSQHHAYIASLAVDPKGLHYASADQEGVLIMRRLEDGIILWSKIGRFFRGLAFSPDGRQLAGIEHDNTVVLFDVGSREEVRTLSGHTKPPSALAFHPTAPALATVDSEGTIRLWSLTDGSQLATVPGKPPSLDVLAFSPDGQWLVTGAVDSHGSMHRVRLGSP